MMQTTDQSPIIHAIDHLELYVSNARQAAHFYRTALGLTPVAYAGLETGQRDRCSYVLSSGAVRLVLSAPLLPGHPIGAFVNHHGDGVRDVALEVPDAAAAFASALRQGASAVQAPTISEDAHGRVVRATIAAYGDVVHSFIERHAYKGPFLPGYGPLPAAIAAPATGIIGIDHVVANVEQGMMDHWVAFYRDVLGFTQQYHFDDEAISTEYSALMSKVMEGGAGRIKLPINEPAEGRRKSQIDEFLTYFGGPGVQHIALVTADIFATVDSLRAAGVGFISVPAAYYEDLDQRVGPLDESIQGLRERHILVDRDEEGYMLQIFSQPMQDRPTLFVEIIQRKGSRGFGKGNFKALFEALEREQARRGNL